MTGLVYVFEQVMPDPFVLAIGLTLVVALLAVVFAPRGSAPVILDSWYAGTFNILAFACQMILILATGFAVADAAIVRAGCAVWLPCALAGPCRAVGVSGCRCRRLAELGAGARGRGVSVARNRTPDAGGFRLAGRRQLFRLVGLQ